MGRFWFLTGARTCNPMRGGRWCRREAPRPARLRARCSRSLPLAASDAFIAVFEAKYHYNFWRPVTADPQRRPDRATRRRRATPGWLPLGETPMHPEYPCAHCISSSAVAACWRCSRAMVGEDVGKTCRSPASPTRPCRVSRAASTSCPTTRDEVANARIWAGFHYRFSTGSGQGHGPQDRRTHGGHAAATAQGMRSNGNAALTASCQGHLYSAPMKYLSPLALIALLLARPRRPPPRASPDLRTGATCSTRTSRSSTCT